MNTIIVTAITVTVFLRPVFPFPLLELLSGGVPEGSRISGCVPIAALQYLEIYELLDRLRFLVVVVVVVANPNLGVGFVGTVCFSGVVAGEEIGEGAAGAGGAGAAAGGGGGVGGAGARLGAAEVGQGRGVVGGDAGEAFTEAEGAEAGDGDGGVAVAGGEAVGFGIGRHDS